MNEIYRVVDESDPDACEAEIVRLTRSKRGYKAAFTRSANAMDVLIDSSSNNGLLDRSKSKQEAIARERERLEQRYEKLQMVHSRIYELNHDADLDETYIGHIDNTTRTYQQIIEDLGALMIKLLPQGDNHAPRGNNNNAVRPVQALQPSFQLSFDNSPTEKAHWIEQFRSYYEASNLHQLDLPQQQAFLRQGIHSEVWTAISQRLTLDTPIFMNPEDLEEDSAESLLEEAFTIRYPLILRRYNFFTYKRKGNQTFTNFYAKLSELAVAAQLEHMRRDDYLIYRIMVGLDDKDTVDKLLAIPTADFSLEEVHRVATSCEAARNYSVLADLNPVSRNVANKVQHFTPPADQTQGNGKNYSTAKSHKDFQHLTGASKLTALKEHGLCVRCGQEMHPDGAKCPHISTQCHNCHSTGHISRVCGKSRNQAQQTSVVNRTFATFSSTD